MTVPFGREIIPPPGREPFVNPETGQLTIAGLQHMQQMWSWLVAGYPIIPCNVGGTLNAIVLTPIFRPEHGGSGYAHGLTFFWVATATSDATVTIAVRTLAAVPAYVDAVAAGAGDVTVDRPYLAIYADAVADGNPPARFVLK